MKRIAITQRVELIEPIQERRDALAQEWTILAQTCGFLPVILPNQLSTVRRLLEELPVDGVILTGGNDLAVYGGNAPERDEMEYALVDWAVERQVPLLGVCRGMQLLLNHFNTPLHRVEGHVRTEHELSNGDKVNSFHSWGALDCCPPLEILARSGDGVVEAVRHRDYPRLQGVMYHPERYCPFREKDIEFIKEALQL